MTYEKMKEAIWNATDPKKYSPEKLRLAVAKADVNAVDKYGTPLLGDCMYQSNVCFNCSDQACEKCTRSRIICLVDAFIDAGFDVKRLGYKCLSPLAYTSGTMETFYAMKRLLMAGASGTYDEFEDGLRSIGMEEGESNFLGDDARSNLFYAMYEMAERTYKGQDISGIYPYETAIGMKVERVGFLSSDEKPRPTGRGVEYDGVIGFVGEGKCLIVASDRYLMMENDKAEGPFAYSLRRIEKHVAGARLERVLHDMRGVHCLEMHDGKVEDVRYAQRIVRLCFDNGIIVRFTSNNGEVDKELKRSRFNIENMGKQYRKRVRLMERWAQEADEEDWDDEEV